MRLNVWILQTAQWESNFVLTTKQEVGEVVQDLESRRRLALMTLNQTKLLSTLKAETDAAAEWAADASAEST